MRSRHAIFTLLAAILGTPVLGAEDQPPPPSPFGSDPHGMYDVQSQCWVWWPDTRARQYPEDKDAFATTVRCNGKALEGQAKLTWNNRYASGLEEIWDGQFQEGRFSGRSSLQLPNARCETEYRDAKRNGLAVCIFSDGGRQEQTYVDDQADGPHMDLYADGNRLEGRVEKGQRVGIWTRTMRDGRRLEIGVVPGKNYLEVNGTLVAADGARLPGVYSPPHSDPTKPRPIVYPQISMRLNEQGMVSVSLWVQEDGTAQDFRLARSSGFSRLDESALEQLKTWRFVPAKVDGKPIASSMLMHQNFHLQDRR
ncbi:MAG TPA: TonB family protein [Rhizomicrobium sp.]|nr:TonB family protein [Rhizomicrobium sp.]